MYIWDKGWKEFKLGSVYGVAPETRIDQRTGDVGEFGHAVQPSYVAYLGGRKPSAGNCGRKRSAGAGSKPPTRRCSAMAPRGYGPWRWRKPQP